MNRHAERQRSLLTKLFHEAVRAAAPERIVDHLPPPPTGRVIVLGAGKASAAMAAALEKAWPDVDLRGLVITPYAHAVSCRRVEIVEAGHPVPDVSGIRATERILALARSADAEDLVIALISGGGSALLVKPAPGVTLEEKQALTRRLLAAGAPIDQVNCVRRHISQVKGGRLALAAAPARVFTFVTSDVPGDDLTAVASGPTFSDETTPADALRVLQQCGVIVPNSILQHLQNAGAARVERWGAREDCALVANSRVSLAAAAELARGEGLTPIILGDNLQGEARTLAVSMAAETVRMGRGGSGARLALISGGETTVTVRGPGRGGRNTEFLLALAIALDDVADVAAIACDTDGIDGSEDNAGAVIDSDTLRRARTQGLDAQAFLDRNDSYEFFKALDDLVFTGPTLTNVNDFRAIVITPG